MHGVTTGAVSGAGRDRVVIRFRGPKPFRPLRVRHKASV